MVQLIPFFTFFAMPVLADADNTPGEEGNGNVPHAAPPTSARLYRTNEERREAGLKRHITPWLTVSGLAEGEYIYNDYDVKKGKAGDSGRDRAANLQLGFVASPNEFFSAELITEFDTESNKAVIDEAYIAFEKSDWELSLGKMFTPFGTFFSSFVSSPILEFGETQANEVAMLTYGPSDDLEVSLAAYRGRAVRQGGGDSEWSWALGSEVWLNQDWSFGLSYQSDLLDSSGRILAEYNDRYVEQVAGVSGFLLWAGDMFEISLEALGATGRIRELDPDRNRPWAWNVELLHFRMDANYEIAFRVEGSEELEDEPKFQYGAAITWRTAKHASLTLEYLHGEFDGTLATTDEDIPYSDVSRFGAILSVIF